MKKKKLGFIGAGNMGEALVRGILQAGLATPRSILVSDDLRQRTDLMKKRYRVVAAAGNEELARLCDVVFLAVKPQQVDSVLGEIGPSLDRSKLVISLAAGVTLSQIESALPAPARLVRIMPNTPALVGAGATAVCCGHLAAAADRTFVMRIFSAVGRVVEVREELMDAVTGLSGSGPAFVFTLIQGLADGGVQAGLPREMAGELAAQTVLGAARMVLETGRHPIELRDQVASPGGTTIQGIAVLEEGGFKGLLMEAVLAAAEWSAHLSER